MVGVINWIPKEELLIKNSFKTLLVDYYYNCEYYVICLPITVRISE